MSRATARAAVAAWIAPPNVAGLNKVYASPPKVISSTDYAGAAGVTAGCVAVIYILSRTDERIAIGGATSGWKRVRYVVDLDLWFRDTQPDAVVAQAAFDATVDALLARLRTDRTLGSPDVWQALEGGLTDRSSEPQLEGDVTVIRGDVQFLLDEMIQA